MSRIAPPHILVCDGHGGIEKARRLVWPNTRVQRCTFHAFLQVQRYTTTNPKLEAGKELYALAKKLLRIKDQKGAGEWLVDFAAWCTKWEEFLKERTEVEGKRQFKHERLRKARKGLVKLCKAGTLFTYLDEDLLSLGDISATSNKIESYNAQIRALFRNHRGMSLDHRIKAGFWFCYMNSEAPLSPAEMLRQFPTDEKIRTWVREAYAKDEALEEVERWGKGIVWSEFHSEDFNWN